MSTQRQIVSVRIEPQHVAELRRLAAANATTVSRLVARCVANQLDATKHTANDRHAATSALRH